MIYKVLNHNNAVWRGELSTYTVYPSVICNHFKQGIHQVYVCCVVKLRCVDGSYVYRPIKIFNYKPMTVEEYMRKYASL